MLNVPPVHWTPGIAVGLAWLSSRIDREKLSVPDPEAPLCRKNSVIRGRVEVTLIPVVTAKREIATRASPFCVVSRT